MITPVLLCGGSGTRLWPLSRKSYPKQFSPLVGDHSLFQASALRLTGADFHAPLILTNSDFRFIVTEQLAEIGIDPGAILIEPEGRNTAPAILAAALHLAKIDPDMLMLVAPSDHIIPDIKAFHDAVSMGVDAAKQGALVTFGVAPTRAETGYGYLEMAPSATADTAQPLMRFVEKPNAEQADLMLKSGHFLWNAGIFLFQAKSILQAFHDHAADLINTVQPALENAQPDLGFLRLAPKDWAATENISIDYAVMEAAKNLTVVHFSAGWSDMGDWEAVLRESGPDARGVVTTGAATAIDCDNTLLRSEDTRLEIVGIGLKNIIAVAMPDAVLVADIACAQDVKGAVTALKEKQVSQAQRFPREHRPWGWFDCLVKGPRFQVKRIVVNPGGALSLQSHRHRSEHWTVVEGNAKVTIDGTVQMVAENQSVYIPAGAVHRMENPGEGPMILIEVQTGSYLGEDDIQRFEDIYARQ